MPNPSHPHTLPSRSKEPMHNPKLAKAYGFPNARKNTGPKTKISV